MGCLKTIAIKVECIYSVVSKIFFFYWGFSCNEKGSIELLSQVAMNNIFLWHTDIVVLHNNARQRRESITKWSGNGT